MSGLLSIPMWAGLFAIANDSMDTVGIRTVQALEKRGLIEHGLGGRWRVSPHGAKIVNLVVQIDVS